MRLQLDSRLVGQLAVVKCGGRIVAGPEADALDAAIKKLLAESRHFVLDLGSVDFIDSTGLGTLVRLLGMVRAAHGDLKLCNVPTTVAHTLHITNLHTLLDMHACETDALAALRQRSPSHAGELRSGSAILCLDRSEGVLAYLRELLRRAGYAPLTANNPFDGRILLSATRPVLVILGPNPVVQPGGPERALQQAIAGIPLLKLDSTFSTVEAGEAAQHLLEQVRSHIGAATARKQA